MKHILLLVLLTISVGVRAATIEGVTFPDTYPVQGQTLRLNGTGLRTVTILAVRAYVAALYLPRQTHSAAEALSMPGTKVIWMQFLHAASKSRVEAEFREGAQNNCGDGGCAMEDKADFERLIAASPGVEVGDTSTYIFTPTGMRVLANNKLIGEFANPDLGRLILAGFIGSHPPSAALKAGLLGSAPS